ncbi:MAG: hypothetical protein KH828_10675 [Clostridiales bacterium]|nr:hypothetical protein [Clostridiales bacterium]
MKIGVDADGVLTDLAKFQYECGEKFFRRKPSCPSGYSISEVFQSTKAGEFLFGLRYFIPYCKTWPPRENAAKIIRKLNADGNTLTEITARKFVMMKNPIGRYSRKMFETWLQKYGFGFEKIIYCAERNTGKEKYMACVENGIEVMIDDRPEVALYLAERQIKVLLFDAPYNQNLEHRNITRIESWEEVYRKIRNSSAFYTERWRTKCLIN